MVIREFYKTRSDGVDLYRTYSAERLVLVQNETGIQYDEAIDVDGAKFTYSETDINVNAVPEGRLPEPPNEFGDDEATADDLYNALSEMGVDVS